jgi:hypothetical protein
MGAMVNSKRRKARDVRAMEYLSLRQDYEELIALENVLLDCQRRLLHASKMGVTSIGKNNDICIVGTGFSAILAFHALRSYCNVSDIYDSSSKAGSVDLPGVEVHPLEELSSCEHSAVILACAPGMADDFMRRVQDALPSREKVLLFSPCDSENSVKYDADSCWLHLNMSYRCVNAAVNMARRYRPVSLEGPAPFYVMGSGLAGLLARHGVGMFHMDCAGYVGEEKVPSDADLLVTVAPETFTGRERELCEGLDCRSAQFLFRQGDSVAPSLSFDGFTDCRLLGGGEEGYVFDAIGLDGVRYCYKRFYVEEDRSSELEWVRSFGDGPSCLSWMREAQGLPGKGAETGVFYPYVKLGHIPFMDESREDVLRATVAYCLRFQKIHVIKGRVPATMPGGIHVMCDEAGKLRFIDIGNYPPALSNCSSRQLKGYIIKGLAGLTHETLFSGKGWKNLNSEESLQALSDRLESVDSVLPGWYLDILKEVLSLPSEMFSDKSVYEELEQKYELNSPVLTSDVALRAHSYTPAPVTAPVDDDGWYHEHVYQTYRYKKGKIEGFGRTGAKHDLIKAAIERFVPGSSYLDIGSNMGFFVAKAALLTDKPCNGLEKRGEFGLQANRMFKAIGVDNAQVIPVHFKPGYPLPEYDVVSAFAIIHHLYLVDGAFPSFHDLVTYLSNATRKALLIEYVHNPGYAEQAEKRHGRSFADYNEEGMVEALERHFQYVVKLADVSDTRAMYIASHVSCGEAI